MPEIRKSLVCVMTTGCYSYKANYKELVGWTQKCKDVEMQMMDINHLESEEGVNIDSHY